MGIPLGFDLDLLRTFVAIAEERSFTRAAARVSRTQSAVSLQMQRLEGLLGQTVIVRGKGGSIELSEQGAYLLGRARELLELKDDIMRSIRPLRCMEQFAWGFQRNCRSIFCLGSLIASRMPRLLSRSRLRLHRPASWE